jgi:cytochrome c oxidase subunit 2
MARRARTPLSLLPALPLVGLDGIQSTLAPAGPHADRIGTLGWVMYVGGGLIFLLVLGLAAVAILVPRRHRGWLSHRNAILAGGVAFPLVVLSALLVYGLLVARAMVVDAGAPGLRVEVVGERWWWRVRYLDATGDVHFVSANEIRMPVGVPVEFVLRSQDVIHSFWVPSLAGKLDMIPGRENRYVFAAAEEGVYRGQCAEYCGAQHALMAFYAVAMPPDAFEAWAARQAAPAAEPVTEAQERGRQLFIANGCGACHTVRGTPAEGELGPDLTHVGGRLSIGAGVFPNNVGTLAGWISSVQHLKPEALMPSFGNLEGPELRAIAAYLESLK